MLPTAGWLVEGFIVDDVIMVSLQPIACERVYQKAVPLGSWATIRYARSFPPLRSCTMSLDISTLNDDELAELDTFLLSDACDDEVLSVDEVHGFLTALQVGPRSMPESEWLTMAWGEPKFTDEAQQQHLQGLMLRLNSDLEASLKEGLDFEPLAVEVEEEGEAVVAFEGWCFGFMLGVETCQAEWDKLPKGEESLLAPMAQLALLNSDEEPEMDDEEYESWVELIPGAVLGLYSYWHEQ